MATGRRQRASQPAAAGAIRIIGGRWRGRRLPVPDGEGLRPTADRIRETLFNWLQADIAGAHCLDLFAGSGALGLEALSRGAAHCDFVDSSRDAVRSINASLATLEARDRAACHESSAAAFLARRERTYDLVFLDPPFAADLLPSTCRELERCQIPGENGLVYIESSQVPGLLQLPSNWQAVRQKKAGSVHYGLYRRAGNT